FAAGDVVTLGEQREVEEVGLVVAVGVALIRGVHGERADRAAGGGVAGGVFDLCCVEGDRIRAVVVIVPCAAGRGDAVGGIAERAAEAWGAGDELGRLGETARAGDGDVAAVERGGGQAAVVLVGDGEIVSGAAGDENGWRGGNGT